MLELAETKCLFPVEGEKVNLCLFGEADITETYVTWLNDSEVVKFSNQRFKRHSIESCQDYLKSINRSDAIFVVIKDKLSSATIGTMTAYFSRQHRTADIGIMLGKRECWGRGFGIDAWTTLLLLLHQRAQVRKVTGGTLACNTGMVRIMQSAGMQPDGLRVEQELVGGKPCDILHFAYFG